MEFFKYIFNMKREIEKGEVFFYKDVLSHSIYFILYVRNGIAIR